MVRPISASYDKKSVIALNKIVRVACTRKMLTL